MNQQEEIEINCFMNCKEKIEKSLHRPKEIQEGAIYEKP